MGNRTVLQMDQTKPQSQDLLWGTSPNAVKIQIWIAMIVYLKLAILKERYHLEPSLSKLLHFLEVNLFERKSLINIFQTNTRATHKYEDIQLKLFNY